MLAEQGCEPGEMSWIEADKAADIAFAGELVTARSALTGAIEKIDIVAQREADRAKKLLVADMDSTMITVECLDELADYAGFKLQVAAITERAMRGEIDFAAALDERVGLLKGLSADVITRCYDDRVSISAGAPTLIATMRAHGGRTVLVSGGFTLFADRVAAEIGFDRAVSNILTIESGELAGTVERPLVDASAKERILAEECGNLGLETAETLAIGDGANDKPMIEAAGLGIAYRGKPLLRDAADACLDHAHLSALLYAQGIPRKDWAEA